MKVALPGGRFLMIQQWLAIKITISTPCAYGVLEVPAEDEAHYATLESRQALENLTAVLYPDDSNETGKRTRLMQEYFFVSAGIQSIVRYYKS